MFRIEVIGASFSERGKIHDQIREIISSLNLAWVKECIVRFSDDISVSLEDLNISVPVVKFYYPNAGNRSADALKIYHCLEKHFNMADFNTEIALPLSRIEDDRMVGNKSDIDKGIAAALAPIIIAAIQKVMPSYGGFDEEINLSEATLSIDYDVSESFTDGKSFVVWVKNGNAKRVIFRANCYNRKIKVTSFEVSAETLKIFKALDTLANATT